MRPQIETELEVDEVPEEFLVAAEAEDDTSVFATHEQADLEPPGLAPAEEPTEEPQEDGGEAPYDAVHQYLHEMRYVARLFSMSSFMRSYKSRFLRPSATFAWL